MARTVLILFFLTLIPCAVAAVEAAEDFCQIVLAEERFDLESIQRDIEEAVSFREASERVYSLAETLWDKKAIEKLRYLAFKHDRDRSVLLENSHRVRLVKHESLMAQYDALCSELSGNGSSQVESKRAAGWEAYRKATCDGYGIDLELAETDRRYDEAVLASYQDLMLHQAATEVDIILAERNLAMTGKRIAWARDRVAECSAGHTASRAEELLRLDAAADRRR